IRYQSVLSKKPVYGFKCFLHQCTYDQAIREPQRFISSLHAEGWKVIFLKRSNIVRQAISHFLARRAGAWNRCTSLPQHEYKKTFIKVSDFIRYMRLSETWQQDQIKIANAVPCITIEYEKDLLNQHCHQSAADNVFAYLGIASAPVHTSMRKQADTPLSELIGNYDQIYAVVKKAGYASCLDS
ncbi:MAG: hypothetical protein KKF80_06520, partial [Candidatus Omnitrophica bacterium]|nr:hypothetical protein [Candidatus Omnitrophota bacterium]